MTQTAATRALLKIVSAVVDTVREVGDAPESMVHLALQEGGASPSECTQIVDALCNTGYLVRNDNVLRLGPKAVR